MDTGEGRLEAFNTDEELRALKALHADHRGVFSIGEELEIKGSLFKIKKISPFGIVLKVLK